MIIVFAITVSAAAFHDWYGGHHLRAIIILTLAIIFVQLQIIQLREVM